VDQTRTNSFFYRYVIIGACFSLQAIGVGTHVSYGVFFNSFISEFGWSRAAVSGAPSVAFLLSGLLGIFVGRLNDRIGPRKVMTVTGFFFGLGLLLMSRLDAVWQLYLFYGIVVGIGLSSIDVLALSTTARWFIKKRGIVTGVVKVGTGAGQLTIPLAGSLLIASYGWRTSYIIIGAAVFLLLISIAQLLRRDPSEMGLVDDGKETGGDNLISVGGGLSLREAFHTRQLWIICAVNLAIGFCSMVVMLHIVPCVQEMGVSAVRAAGVLSTIGGVSMAGRFITGMALDRIGSRRVMIVCFILLVVGLLWLQVANELWMFYVFALIYGNIHGGFFTAISPMVAEFFGISAHGVLFGIVAFSGTVGGAVGPVVAGHIFDVTARYSLAFWLCTLTSILGLVLTVSLKPAKERAKVYCEGGE
jgi:MFS family permease